jgi:NADH dehydrogenase/NADH:ubiquinone oxidoreductase subunit G
MNVAVEKGATVLQAAQSAGIYIPTLCYHPRLSLLKSCRICLVDVEGSEMPMARARRLWSRGWWFIPGRSASRG